MSQCRSSHFTPIVGSLINASSSRRTNIIARYSAPLQFYAHSDGIKKQNKQLPMKSSDFLFCLHRCFLAISFMPLLSCAFHSFLLSATIFFTPSTLKTIADSPANRAHYNIFNFHSLLFSIFQNMWMAMRRRHSSRRTTVTSFTSYMRRSSKQKRIWGKEVRFQAPPWTKGRSEQRKLINRSSISSLFFVTHSIKIPRLNNLLNYFSSISPSNKLNFYYSPKELSFHLGKWFTLYLRGVFMKKLCT